MSALAVGIDMVDDSSINELFDAAADVTEDIYNAIFYGRDYGWEPGTYSRIPSARSEKFDGF